MRGQAHLRQILSGMNADLVHKPEVMLAQAPSKFDENLQLIDETARNFLRDLVANLATTISRKRRLDALQA